MRITLRKDSCIGAGECVFAAPEVFDQDDEDGLVVQIAEPGPDDEDAVRSAAHACPAAVIELH